MISWERVRTEFLLGWMEKRERELRGDVSPSRFAWEMQEDRDKLERDRERQYVERTR